MSEKMTFIVTVEMDKPLWKSKVAQMLRVNLKSACTYFGVRNSEEVYTVKRVSVRPLKEASHD